MSTMVDIIEMLIKDMLDENGGEARINRSYLAEQVSCVPSQITYVVKTRFSSDNGYIVESKRGGGGQIMIRRLAPLTQSEYLMQMYNNIDSRLTQQQARVVIENSIRAGALSLREGNALLSSISDNALEKVDAGHKTMVRSDILKNALIGYMMND